MDAPDQVSVGIVSTGMYLPEPVLTAAEIAAESGFPEWVVRDKLGINQKHMAGPDDHPNQMAIWAAQDCLSKCDISPEEIDVVLCTTEEWKEYIQWTAGIDLAYEIGATRAWGRCARKASSTRSEPTPTKRRPGALQVGQLLGGTRSS